MTTICGHSVDEFVEMVTRFHGFPAPGIIISGFMVDLALELRRGDGLYEVLCETSVCLPDAVQLLTPCTFGNGWMKVADTGRFALAVFDKRTGEGVRVHLDARKLAHYPEINAWFFRLKPKKEQDGERLNAEILAAGKGILGSAPVKVARPFLGHHGMGDTALCPSCGEAYPVRDGDRCKACGGWELYEK